MSELAFGLTAASRPDHSRLAAEIERLGYAELWVNDTRRGDGVRALAELHPGTTSLRFGLGVVALSEYTVSDIADRLLVAGLPLDRLTIGVGSGSSSSLDLVRSGVAELRDLFPGTPIAVAAVGPRMARLAGEIADAVVANWALPDRIAFVRDRVNEGAAIASRLPPRLVVYVRTAIGPGATGRLRASMEQYRAYGSGHYARAFDAQPDALVGVAVESGDRAELGAAVAPYRSVADTVVIRGLPSDDSVDAWVKLAESAARAALNGDRGR
jgi:alkanesulfonate monooxygenase SsuD/methylene tetrahydromethanopterin reductase-like flavin-dependent oxidoreductase (luciferase family)